MADLERHKEEYNNKIEAWIKKRENSRKKLKMTQDMLRQLEREKDKVCGRELLSIDILIISLGQSQVMYFLFLKSR